MKIAAVTTFNAEGLELYGRRMVRTFVEHWPSDIEMAIYAEGWFPFLRDDRLRYFDLANASPWLGRFKHRHGDKTEAHFRKDAVRFSHKVAALCHAASWFDGDVLIWLDGDIVTHSPVSRVVLEDLAPKGDEWIAWLDRDRMYPECGFYMLNCRHPRHREAIAAFEAMYAEDRLFALPEWHDSFVLAQVVASLGIGMKSLSGDGRSTSHPLVNGPLSQWFDHLKGPRKHKGRTPARERRIMDGHGYWS